MFVCYLGFILFFLTLAGIAALGLLCAVLGTTLSAAINAQTVQGTSDDMITNAGEVTHTTALHEDDTVFLQVVTFATDVSGNLDTIGKTHASDLTQSGVRLFRGSGRDLQANATTLRALLECLALALTDFRSATASHQLIDCRHIFLFTCVL